MIIGGIVAAIIMVSGSFDLQDLRTEVLQNNVFFPRHCRVGCVLVG